MSVSIYKLLLLRDRGKSILGTLRGIAGYLVSWPLQEMSGDVALADNIAVPGEGVLPSSDYPGAEELSAAGTGVMDVVNWMAEGGANGSNPTSEILRITHVGSNNPRQFQDKLVVGERYVATGEARSDGNAIPKIWSAVLDDHWVGTTSTDWQNINIEFIATDTEFRLVSSTSTITYYTEWRNVSVKEANPLNGDSTGATVGQPGNGKIATVYSFDGVGDVVDIESTEYNSIYDPTTDFTKLIPVKISTWDATERFIFHDYVDANNYIAVRKTTTVGQLAFDFMAGGTLEQILHASGSPTDFILLDVGRDSGTFKARVNGVNVGSEAIAGTFAGNFTINTIGAENLTPTKVFLGDTAYPTNYTTYVSDADMVSIASGMGIS